MCTSGTFPSVARKARVSASREAAPFVYEIVIDRANAPGNEPVEGNQAAAIAIPLPLAGQFFMLRSCPSGVLLGRPISVYYADETVISFLVLNKGKGSAELCALREGDTVDIIGPIGNRFATPDELVREGKLKSNARVALIGGGIGVAPVIGFALELPEHSFDFFGSFRTQSYGIDRIEKHAKRVIVTTEDGSSGTKGMLPAVFDASQYDVVYACGPTPMLRYVQSACSSGPLALLSLEQHMACGAGACLGCTVRTLSGNRRCCVDGPIFNAAEVLL